jgi:N-acetylmuramoyl-L-alanine amidase
MLRRASGIAALLLCAAVAHADPILSGRRIVLDAGHATIDYEQRVINTGKTTRDGVSEHKIAFEIAQYLGKMLQDNGATVLYTRNREDYWRAGYSPGEDNKSRIYFANEVKADAFISIHCDWHPSRRFQGVTTFYLKDDSRRLGEIIQHQLVKDLRAFNRKLVNESFTVLDHAEVPAVLVETGFLSHRNESRKLLKPEYQKKVASALAAALRRYLTAP